MKKSLATAGLLLGLFVLTSCGNNPQAPSNSDDPKSQAEQAALKYQAGSAQDQCRLDASKSGAKLDDCLASASSSKPAFTAEPKAVASEPWRGGYGVVVEFQPSNGDKLTVVYGMEQVNGTWKMAEFNQVDSSLATDPQRVCKTLGTC